MCFKNDVEVVSAWAWAVPTTGTQVCLDLTGKLVGQAGLWHLTECEKGAYGRKDRCEMSKGLSSLDQN